MPPEAGRIAIFLSALTIGSRERLMFEVAGRLAADGHAVDLVTAGAAPGWGQPLPEQVRVVDLVPWTRQALARVNPARLVLGLPALVAYLIRERPAVLLGVSIPPSLVALTARRLAAVPTRILVRQSNVVHVTGDTRYQGVRPRWRDGLMRRLYPGADGFIAVSGGVADNLRHLLPGRDTPPVQVIYNHVVTADFAARAGQSADHPWLHADAPPCVVAVGRLVPKKDYPTLLRAFAVLARHRDLRLLVLGQGPEQARLQQLIDTLGIEDRVTLLGHVTNPLPYLRRASLYVLSSISEGMPSALVEALACGCSTVSTDCPSGPAEILEHGRYGRLVPVGEPAALASAMAAGLDDPPPRALVCERARHFSAHYGIAAYAKALASTVPGGAPGSSW